MQDACTNIPDSHYLQSRTPTHPKTQHIELHLVTRQPFHIHHRYITIIAPDHFLQSINLLNAVRYYQKDDKKRFVSIPIMIFLMTFLIKQERY